MRPILLMCAALLIVAAITFHKDLVSNAATTLGLVPPPQAHMNMVNRLGDKDFYCLDSKCADTGGFEGRQTGRLYRNRIDAVLGRPMITNR